jgi:hypothetical protein
MELIVASLSFLAVSPEGAVEGTDELLTGHSFSYLSRQVASAAGISISHASSLAITYALCSMRC